MVDPPSSPAERALVLPRAPYAALTQIQAKVAQVRNDLPPEAEAPTIDLQTADNQFAAIYLGFSSADLDPNQVTDYLTRVVQPKLSAISGVQRADILGARTFAAIGVLGSNRTVWRRTAFRRRWSAMRSRATTLSPRSGKPRAPWCRSTSSRIPTCERWRSSAR